MLNFFEFFDVRLQAVDGKGSQVSGDCPFCGKTKHFFANPTTGLWDCKKCGREGNPAGFITQLHQFHLETTTDEHYDYLASKRNGVLASTLKEMQFAHDPTSGAWYVPYGVGRKFLNNLGKFYPEVGFRIYKAPEMNLKLYHPFDKKIGKKVIITEGEWDLAAFRSVQKFACKDYTLVSVPGSNTFKDEYLDEFKGADVILIYDKDDPGRKGIAKAAKKLTPVAKSVLYVKWTEEEFNDANGEVNGKDLRDYLVCKKTEHAANKSKKKPKFSAMFWQDIQSMLALYQPDQNDDGYIEKRFTLPPTQKCESWEQLMGVYRKKLYLTPGNEHSIACCFATALSPFFPGEPVWLFFVGRPSSGKTTVIEAFGDSNMYIDAQSQLSARVLVSGLKTAGGKDISYLPTLKLRTLTVKDFTAILTMGAKEQEELYGILRDAFDGEYKRQFGNNEKRFYKDLKFGIIAGVTKSIHAQNHASLGERFLKIEYLENEEFDEYEHMQSALSGMHDKAARKKILQEYTLGYLDHLANNLPDFLPAVGSKFRYRVSLLALLVARLRAQVERRRDDSLLYRPEWEVASRLACQFEKMAQLLMLVYNLKEPNNLLYLTIRKLALDSCIPFNVEFAKRMFENPMGITRNKLIDELQVPSTNVHRLLTDLQQLGLIRCKQKKGKVGRPLELYSLSYEVQRLWQKSVEVGFDGKPIPAPVKKKSIPRRTRNNVVVEKPRKMKRVPK